MKRFILLSGTLVLALLALQWGLRRPSFLHQAKQAVARHMAQALDRPVRIGQIRAHLFPPSLILSDITSGAPPESLRVKEVRIVLSPRLAWPPQIGRIVVERPSVTLTETMLRHLLQKKREPSRVQIRAIQIKDGLLDYQGEGSAALRHLHAQGVQGTLYPNPTTRQVRVDLTEAEGHITIGRNDYRIDRIKGEALFQPHQLHIQHATLVSERTTLRAEGTFQPTGGGWDLALSGQAPIEALPLAALNAWDPSGLLILSGRLKGISSSMQFEGEAALPHLSLMRRDAGALRARLTYRDREVIVSSASGSLFSGALSGGARWQMKPTDSETRSPVQAQLRYQGLPLVEAVRLIAQQRSRTFEEDASDGRLFGGILIDGNVVFRAGATGLTASGNILGHRKPRSIEADVSSSTSLLHRLVPIVTQGAMSWTWSVPAEGAPVRSNATFAFTQGRLLLPGAEALLNGRWSRASGLHVEAELRAEEMAAMAERLQIPATGALQLTGLFSMAHGAEGGDRDTPAPRFEGVVSLNEWTLKGRKFGAAAASILYRDRLLSFRDGSVRNMPATIPTYRFDGGFHFSEPPTFDFQVQVAEADPQDTLAFFRLAIPLQTTATGPLSIRGTPGAFSVSGPLTLGAGHLYGEPFQKGRLILTVTQTAVSLDQVVLEGTDDIRLSGAGEIQYAGAYRVEARVTHAEKSGRFQSRLPKWSGDVALTLNGEGRLKSPVLNVVATSGGLRYDQIELGTGSLNLRVVGDAVRFDGQLRQALQTANLSGTVRLSDLHPFSFQGRFSSLRLDPWVASQRSGSNLSATVTGEISGDGTLQQWERANLNVALSDVAAKVNGYSLRNDGPIQVRAEQGVYTIEKARFTGENTGLAFQGGFVPLARWDVYVQGEADLKLLPLFLPQITSGRGTARLGLRVSDQWKSPHIQGEVAITQGLLRTPWFPDPIYIAAMSAIFSERRLVLETLRGRMGGGPFDAEGSADWVGWGRSNFRVRVGLHDVAFPLHADLSAVASGALLIQGNLETQQVTGDITLKNAVYNKRVELKSFITDLLTRNDPPSVSDATALDRVGLNILVRGSEYLVVDNNLGKVFLDLDLSLRGTPRRPLPVGRVAIREGHLYFQNNDFRITSGSLEFLTWDRIDPTFNVKAEAQTRHTVDNQEYAIALTLSGTLSQFTLDLSTSPPLPEKEALALLSGEATALVVSEILEGPIQRVTGIDRVRIAPNSAQSGGARIIAEKRLLKDRLSVTYATPLESSESPQIRMVYTLSPQVSLVGEQDEEGRKGGEIRFRFDFR